jgi:hypothetical protein
VGNVNNQSVAFRYVYSLCNSHASLRSA